VATEIHTPAPFSRRRLTIYRLLFSATFVLLLAGALAIPFYFETKTLWYKVGIDKTMLRGGQVAGMLALVFLFLQITLSLRSTLLEKLFGAEILLRWHRINGVVIGILAISHVLLVLVPEGISNLPIGKKYWPEMVGMLLFLIIVSMVVSSHFRQKLKLNYKKWKAIHRPLGYLVVALVTIHALYVSESFEQDSLQIILLVIFGALIVQVVVVKRFFHATK
jgi:predicted ferric reductase